MKIINKYISISDKIVNDTAELYIYGDIVDRKDEEEDIDSVSVSSIQNELKKLGNVKTLELHIASCGGSVFAGNPIFNALDSYKRKNNVRIETYIDGLAASMASGIACVGDVVYAAENSLIMLHRPMAKVFGNAEELQSKINLLATAEETLLRNYMRKFNGTEEKLKDLLAAETWLTAEEAKEYGFVDEIIEPIELAASANGITIRNQTFQSLTADMIKNKYPNITFEKEESKVVYNEALNEFGIAKELFDSWEEKDILLNLAKTISESVKPAVSNTAPEFMDKAHALEILGVEDVTADEILNYAKSGMNPPDISAIQNKANDYDKIVDAARANALVSACKAKGDTYNESRVKKMLDVLNYQEIIDQTNEWDEEAKKALHAGQRISVPESNLENHTKEVKAEDYNV